MDRRKRRGGTVADGDIQQMDVQAVGGGIGNRNGNGPAVRRPGRKVKRTDVIADAAGSQMGFMSARRIGGGEGRFAFYTIVAGKSHLGPVGGESNETIKVVPQLSRGGPPARDRESGGEGEKGRTRGAPGHLK